MIKPMKMKIMQHSITNYIKNGVYGKFIFITKNWIWYLESIRKKQRPVL